MRVYHSPRRKHDVLEYGIAVAERAGRPEAAVIELIHGNNVKHFFGELLKRYAGTQAGQILLPEERSERAAMKREVKGNVGTGRRHTFLLQISRNRRQNPAGLSGRSSGTSANKVSCV